ncbi:hypothetical protein [Streptomyces shenzhenensis]|uniref:hypothetical protein n=1 Tax=Streptomyces shenzhenensis TaxID=943815 RepID=UPI003402EE48
MLIGLGQLSGIHSGDELAAAPRRPAEEVTPYTPVSSIVAATDAGVPAARPVGPGETIAAGLALADEAGRREQLARAVSARLARDAEHVMRVTAHTERMISILHEWQRSDIQHADHT